MTESFSCRTSPRASTGPRAATVTSTAPKPVVAVDLDEVIFPYVSAYLDFYNSVKGTRLTLPDVTSYYFPDFHGGSLQECEDIIREMHESSTQFKDSLPLPGSVNFISRLLKLVDVHIVTSRQLSLKSFTDTWVDQYLNISPNRIHLLNHFPVTEEDRAAKHAHKTKAEVCLDIGAICIVDDSIGHVVAAINEGLIGILFNYEGKYQWTAKSLESYVDSFDVIHLHDDRKHIVNLLANSNFHFKFLPRKESSGVQPLNSCDSGQIVKRPIYVATSYDQVLLLLEAALSLVS